VCHQSQPISTFETLPRHVHNEDGFFIIRAKAGMNPQVVEAFREDGTRLRSLRNKPLKAIPSASGCSSAGTAGRKSFVTC
jgi:hypothetical protein